MTMAELTCWNCGASLENIPRPISRHANCEKCFEVLHCCRMCRHYDPDRRPYCGEDRADPPVEKENANFCDFFSPVNRFEGKRADTAGKAKDDLAALFGEGESEDGIGLSGEAANDLDRDDPLTKLDDLFDD